MITYPFMLVGIVVHIIWIAISSQDRIESKVKILDVNKKNLKKKLANYTAPPYRCSRLPHRYFHTIIVSEASTPVVMVMDKANVTRPLPASQPATLSSIGLRLFHYQCNPSLSLPSSRPFPSTNCFCIHPIVALITKGLISAVRHPSTFCLFISLYKDKGGSLAK